MDQNTADSFTITYAQIRDLQFNRILMGLLEQKMKFKIANKIIKLAKAIQKAQMSSDEEFKTVSEKYLEPALDADGNPTGTLRVKESFNAEEKVAAEQALTDLAGVKITIAKKKLTQAELAGVMISPAELLKIEALIED